MRMGSITKDVAELIVPSDLNLRCGRHPYLPYFQFHRNRFSIYVYDGIWRQSFLRHRVDLQEVELDALSIPVAADLVEVCAVYGGVLRLEGRTLLMVCPS